MCILIVRMRMELYDDFHYSKYWMNAVIDILRTHRTWIHRHLLDII
jgi:hypothetical protein